MSKVLTFLTCTVAMAAALSMGQRAEASVTLLDRDDWKFVFGGFIETDMIYDSTRSLTEVAGNTAVDRSPSYPGDNSRSQFSIRNSRFSFSVLPPTQNDWKTKGYLEFDLLGYDPNPPSTTNGSSTEASYATNPTTRLRHGYFTAEKEGLQILAGQSWTLFGWNPNYVLTTASVAPVAATIYQRTPEVYAVKNLPMNNDSKLQVALSLARPAQRDSGMPNLEGGARWSSESRRSGFSRASSDVTVEPMSVALTGTYRQFEAPTSGAAATNDITKYSGGAIALDTLIPILVAEGKSPAHTLTMTGEFTSGTGYSDMFPGWTGNLPQLQTPANPTTTTPNLDAGEGGIDSAFNFQLVKLQTWNLQFQYHFSEACHSFATVGYGQLFSSNSASLTPAAGKVSYDKAEAYFVNFFHDFTKQIRVAAEVDRFNTNYGDAQNASDNRYQLSGWFRF